MLPTSVAKSCVTGGGGGGGGGGPIRNRRNVYIT